MKQENPIRIRCACPDFPSPQFDSIRSTNRKILLCSPCAEQHRFRLRRTLGIHVRRMEDARAQSLAHDCSDGRCE